MSGDTIPVDFPFNVSQITISSDPAPGEIYLTDFKYLNDQFGTFLMKLDNAGHVLFERRTQLGAYDFTLQPNGDYTYFDTHTNKYYELDQNFVKVDSFSVTNTDYHELRVFKNGNYILLATEIDTVDMSKIVSGGKPKALVTEYIIYEFGADKKIIFEWHSLDHYQITDAIHENLQARTIDAVHINSVDTDTDGNFIVSVRSLDEISKIDGKTGAFIWRLGGVHNEFTFTDKDTFDYQHDVRLLADGNITMFDNGNHRTTGLYSRGVEYGIDQSAKTLHKVWEFRHTPDIVTDAMGSVQRLPNGNTLIGWGLINRTVGLDSTALTEVKPDGTVALEITLPENHFSYRVYKFLPAVKNVLPTGNNDLILEQNYPNPFSSWTIINFSTNEYGPLSLTVYDALGREVKTLFNGSVSVGEYSAKFDSENLPSGTYIFKLTTPAVSLSRMMILSK